MRVRLTLGLLLVSAIAPSSARAAWADVAPRPFETGAYFELFGSHERDDGRSGGRRTGWSDTFFTEKVALFSNGYVYHPRFLQYQFSVSAALKEENYEQSFAPKTGWTRGSGYEYEGRLLFLPEHPYDFELFALRREPLYREQAATRHDSIETSNGARFRYRKKPWFLHAGYLDNTTKSRTASSNVRRLNLDGEYFKEFGGGNVFSATAFFMPSRFTGSQGLTGSSSQYGASGLVETHRVRFNASASQSRFDQESPRVGRLENDQFAFQERLSASLPVNFKMDFYYRVQNNTSTTSDPGASGPRELADDSKEFEASISHRLYQSLDSRYLFLRTARTSSGGDSTTLSHTFGLNYAKSIPRGKFLSGLNLSTLHSDSTGRTDVPSEPHQAVSVPGTFDLGQPNVERETLAVYLKSPLPPFETIRLVENVHYTVTLVGTTFQIGVFLLPPEFAVPGTYDFLTAYSLTTGTFELRLNTYGFNTSVQLLDNMLTPYYSFLAVRSEVLSGAFPGTPLDSTRNALGLSFQDGPWRALGEYQTVDWAVSPNHAWRAEVQYSGAIDPTLRAYGTATYLHKRYEHGTSAEATAAYTEKSIGVSGGLQKDFLSRSLTLSAGASYSRLLGLVDSNAHALNAALTYRVGKLELSAGADAYGSDARGFGGGRYDRAHQYYYVKVRRRIF